MKQCLTDIQTGEYAKSFILENKAGAPTLQSRRRLTAEHQIEQVGSKLRAMMPWIAKNARRPVEELSTACCSGPSNRGPVPKPPEGSSAPGGFAILRALQFTEHRTNP